MGVELTIHNNARKIRKEPTKSLLQIMQRAFLGNWHLVFIINYYVVGWDNDEIALL